MKRIIAVMMAGLLAACGTQLQVAPLDQKTGLLASGSNSPVSTATVVKSEKLPLARFKGLVFISGLGEYGVNQLKAIGYFDEVVGWEELQKLVIQNKLQDKVPSLHEPIGLNKLFLAYRPFLWIHTKLDEREGNRTFLQLTATNPETLEEVFKCEVPIPREPIVVNDQTIRYPLFNALIAWINENR